MTRRRERRDAGPGRFRMLRFLTALLLGALLVGTPPTLLLLLVGNPGDVPNSLRSAHALTAALDDQTLLWLLSTVAWLLWLHLLGSVGVELLRQAAGSTVRMPLSGLLFGANNLIASHLVAALLLTLHPAHGSGHVLTPATASTAVVNTGYPALYVPSMSYSAAQSDTSMGQASGKRTGTSHAAVPSIGMARECRVLPPEGRHHDTLWDIAERHLGDGTRWHEVFNLNDGRLMPDGHRLTKASLIYPGWILRLPADARDLPRDRVSHPHADDPQRPPAELVVPADGSTLASPTAGGSEPSARASTASHATTQLATDDAAEPRQQLTHEQPSQLATQPPTAAAQAPVPAATAKPNHDPQVGATATTNPSPGEAVGGGDGPSSNDTHAVAAGGLALAAIGLLAGLTRRRRIAARRRPPGRRAATPAPELTAAEAQLRQDARAAADVAATVRLALLLAARTSTATTVKAVWHHPDGSLELVLTEPTLSTPGSPPAPANEEPCSAPYPFESTDRGWRLPSGARRYLFATRTSKPLPERLREALETAVDPFPLLLPVGTQDGSACYVNLEIYGLVSILNPRTPDNPQSTPAKEEPEFGSERDLAVRVFGALVQGLAGAPWAELMQLAVAPPLADVAVGMERIDVLHPDLLTRLLGFVDNPVPHLVAVAGSLEAARRTDPDGAGIIGTVVLAGLTADQTPDRLLAAATRSTEPLAILLLGPHPDAHPWQLQQDGTLTIPGIATSLRPLLLDPGQHQVLLRLLEHAQDPPLADSGDPGLRERDLDNPPATLTSPGAPIPSVRTSGGPATLGDGDRTVLDLDAVLTATDGGRDALADASDVEASMGERDSTPTPDECPAPLEEGPGDSAAEPTPPTADTDEPEQAPGAPEVVAIEISILGPVLVTGAEGAWTRGHVRELLVYLAVHRRPVGSQRLWEAVFPDRAYNPHVLRSRMSDLRKHIRRQLISEGQTWLLAPTVSCDWQRFRALAEGDRTEQLAALQLVRGLPFDGLDSDWLHLEGHHAEIEAAIVDLALALAQAALDEGDPATASTAAHAGLRASPYDERLYRLAMTAAGERGATGQIRALRRQLERVLDEDLEPEDSLQPATAQLYRDLLEAEKSQRT
ncbi:MAG: hypothetical protein JWM02_1295 [Frankiales bacterium]|nr:hypothetical protein [Frankiales bacterium]